MYNGPEKFWTMKKCLKCNIEKPIIQFYKKTAEKDGRHRYCNVCMKEEKKQYYSENKSKRADYYKTYREQNKEYFNNYSNNHYHTKKELYREWNKNKYHTDPSFRIKHVTSARIFEALKTYQTLKRDRTIEYLGCTMEEYTQYLEYSFTSEMSWDNYGTYWEIDHIQPVDSFDLNIEENLYKCFHYLNTQPLEKDKNREKSNKY
jgi:hypothetical protein